MIRLLTATTINGGYLNFMGNEFGHPEWIDFPREGNGWSCKYARRQWNLVDNKNLAYHYMGDFDAAMLGVVKSIKNFQLLRSKKYGIMTVTRYWLYAQGLDFCIQLQP